MDDSTRAAWMEAVRSAAERGIADLWQPGCRFALLDAGPRRRDRKGRITPGAGMERSRTQTRAFYDLRYRLSIALVDSKISASEATAEVAASEFAGELRIAESKQEATNELTELLASGNNTWSGSDFRGVVVWVTAWRD